MSSPSPPLQNMLLSDVDLDIQAYINQELATSLTLSAEGGQFTTEERLTAVDKLRASVQLQVRELSKEMAQCQRDWAQALPQVQLETRAIEARALALSQRASRLGTALGALDLSLPRDASGNSEE